MKILTSGCLYGWHCRYDAEDCPCEDERYLKWKEEGVLIPVCPEVFGGLPTPRPDCQRVGEKIVDCESNDYTKEYQAGADEALRLAKEHEVVCCIMKEYSPSCGSKCIFDGKFTDTIIKGQGMATELLINNGYKIFSEEELDEAEKFIKK